MMNHAQLNKAVMSYIEKGEEGFELVTEGKRDYEIGENVDMFYGDRGNSDLLVSSGFVVPVENFEGQKDDVKAWMRIWEEDGLGKMKVRNRLGAQLRAVNTILALKLLLLHKTSVGLYTHNFSIFATLY